MLKVRTQERTMFKLVVLAFLSGNPVDTDLMAFPVIETTWPMPCKGPIADKALARWAAENLDCVVVGSACVRDKAQNS